MYTYVTLILYDIIPSPKIPDYGQIDPLLIGGLEHEFHFPSIGNNNPN